MYNIFILYVLVVPYLKRFNRLQNRFHSLDAQLAMSLPIYYRAPDGGRATDGSRGGSDYRPRCVVGRARQTRLWIGETGAPDRVYSREKNIYIIYDIIINSRDVFPGKDRDDMYKFCRRNRTRKANDIADKNFILLPIHFVVILCICDVRS